LEGPEEKKQTESEETLEKMFWSIFPSIRLSKNACSPLPKTYKEHLPDLDSSLIQLQELLQA